MANVQHRFEDRTMPAPFRIGFLLFPNITHLDLTGPHEVLSQMPGAEIHLIW
jgi:cyclohexyl-isocyanide hydratase